MMSNNKILPIIHVLCKAGIMFSFLLLIPALVSYLYQDDLFLIHMETFVVILVANMTLFFCTRSYQRELQSRDGFTLVFLLWIGFALIASLPIYFTLPDLSFSAAYFEAISGLTTTGSTVIPDLDHLAPSIQLWRHMLNWLGGMGIIVLAVAILPMLGVGGMQLFRAEVSGINKGQKLAPRIAQTAKRLWAIYIVFTAILLMALKLAGMNWLDAVCHAMSSISLGGFSTHSASVAYFDSVTIEIILAVGMLFGGISFINHFNCLSEKKIFSYWKDEEVRMTFYLLFLAIAIACLYLWLHTEYTFLQSLRHSFFNFISIGLAGGYASVDFDQWPLVVSLMMFLLANVLANSGSTGGGIKMIRVIVLFKFMMREMLLLIHPNAVKTVKVNKTSIPDKTALTVLAFIFAYFMSIVIFSFLMMFSGMDFLSAFSFVVASITNAGPGLGTVGPFADLGQLSEIQKWLSCLVMLIGRLEVFTVFILLTPAYWKK